MHKGAQFPTGSQITMRGKKKRAFGERFGVRFIEEGRRGLLGVWGWIDYGCLLALN